MYSYIIEGKQLACYTCLYERIVFLNTIKILKCTTETDVF